MEYETTIRKQGNGTYLTLPKTGIEKLDLKKDEIVLCELIILDGVNRLHVNSECQVKSMGGSFILVPKSYQYILRENIDKQCSVSIKRGDNECTIVGEDLTGVELYSCPCPRCKGENVANHDQINFQFKEFLGDLLPETIQTCKYCKHRFTTYCRLFTCNNLDQLSK